MCRKWAAIGTIAALLEQKVWTIQSQGIMYPNLYIWFVSEAGIGKSNAVKNARKLLEDIDDLFFAPTSVTSASLVDFMEESQRIIPRPPNPPLTYQPGIFLPDELSAFMPAYDHLMIGLLTTMYDGDVKYSESRRTHGIHKKLTRPCLTMMVGTTPSNLLKYLPDYAWDQGFTSRVILVQADRRPGFRDRFAVTVKRDDTVLLHDLECINRLTGEFYKEEEFTIRFNAWMKAGERPMPKHPRLVHYNTRRFGHMLKLCMVSSADRGDSVRLTPQDFERASSWLFEAEERMPSIFDKGIKAPDKINHDQLEYFIRNFNGATIREDQVFRKAKELLPVYAVRPTIEVLIQSGVLTVIKVDKNGQRVFSHD